MNYFKKFLERPKFDYLFWNYFFCYIPFGIIVSILSLIGISPVKFNDQLYDGIFGFLISLVYIPMVAVILGFINWLFLYIGNFFLRQSVKLFGHEEAERKISN